VHRRPPTHARRVYAVKRAAMAAMKSFTCLAGSRSARPWDVERADGRCACGIAHTWQPSPLTPAALRGGPPYDLGLHLSSTDVAAFSHRTRVARAAQRSGPTTIVKYTPAVACFESGNLQTALGLCPGCFFPERAPKASLEELETPSLMSLTSYATYFY